MRLAPLLAGLTLLIAPATASAAVRAGAVTDPMDAQDTTPTLDQRDVTPDITDVRASYDDTGTATVAVTFAASSDVPPDVAVHFGCVDAPGLTVTIRRERDYAAAEAGASAWTDAATGTLAGFEGTTASSQVPAPPDSRTLTGTVSHPALAGRGYRCAYGEWRTETSSRVLDDAFAFWFAGFEPQTITAETARRTAEAALRARLGTAYTAAGARYLKCPKEEVFRGDTTLPGTEDEDEEPIDEAERAPAFAICMFHLRTGRRVTSGSLTVQADDQARTVAADKPYVRRFTRGWRSCASRSGRLRANMPCGGLSLLTGDIDALVSRRFPKAPPGRFSVFTHGTNTAGFTEMVRYRCRARSRMVPVRGEAHDARRTVATCKNAVGDGFTYTVSVA